MKKILTFLFVLFCLSTYSQTLQNINKISGTVSSPINQIDSIRFNTVTNQIEVVLQSGVEAHDLTDIIDITFTSSSGGCGPITSVTDIDGNEYPVVSIGDQCWTAENLKTTRFSDGSVIPNAISEAEWAETITPAWCNYENNAANDITYGKLYNWYTAADPRNACPTGWHVPTDDDWFVLTTFLGGTSVAGGKLKTTSGWIAPNTSATNETGFSGLPGASRYDNFGPFGNVGYHGDWWSSTESSSSNAFNRSLFYFSGSMTRDGFSKRYGFSVRCLKD